MKAIINETHQVERLHLTHPYKIIEAAGRLCYKSKTQGLEPFRFIKSRIEEGHESIIEHAWWRTDRKFATFDHLFGSYTDGESNWVNARTIRDALREDEKNAVYYFQSIIQDFPVLFSDLITMELPEGDPVIRWTFGDDVGCFFITTTRDISHQLVRHRTLSVSQESQRWVAYTKFDELEFILSTHMGLSSTERMVITEHLDSVANLYELLMNKGLKPEWARKILPNCTQTTLIMSAPRPIWDKFFALRVDSHAQPDMYSLAAEMKNAIYPQ